MPDNVTPKPFTVWLDHALEGWHPEDCDTVEACFAHMLSIGHCGAYRITSPVEVEFIAKHVVPDGV